MAKMPCRAGACGKLAYRGLREFCEVARIGKGLTDKQRDERRPTCKEDRAENPVYGIGKSQPSLLARLGCHRGADTVDVNDCSDQGEKRERGYRIGHHDLVDRHIRAGLIDHEDQHGPECDKRHFAIHATAPAKCMPHPEAQGVPLHPDWSCNDVTECNS